MLLKFLAPLILLTFSFLLNVQPTPAGSVAKIILEHRSLRATISLCRNLEEI